MDPNLPSAPPPLPLTQVPNIAVSNEDSTTPPPAPKKSLKKIILTVFILLLVVISAAAFLAGFMSKQPQTQQPQETPLATSTAEPTSSPVETQQPNPQATATAEPQGETLTLHSTPELDGFASSNGSGNNTVDIRAGRNTFAITRGFISFDLTTLPDNANIQNAVLRLYQTHVSGDPYTAGGSVKIDHMEFGDSLDGNDYPLAPLQTGLATLTSTSEIGWKEIVVTEALKQDILNNRTRSQYRIGFASEIIGGESGGDFAYFESGENFVGTGNTPQLVVTYQK